MQLTYLLTILRLYVSPLRIFLCTSTRTYLLRQQKEHLELDTWILADRTNGRAIGTVLRPSVCRLSVDCNVMYCG